jgi:hypothetical protein
MDALNLSKMEKPEFFERITTEKKQKTVIQMTSSNGEGKESFRLFLFNLMIVAF